MLCWRFWAIRVFARGEIQGKMCRKWERQRDWDDRKMMEAGEARRQGMWQKRQGAREACQYPPNP